MKIAGKCFFFFCMLMLGAFPGNSTLQKQYCNIYGSVYIVDNPREADYRVFVEETEGSADLWVFDTDDKLFADRPGLWFFTETQAFADFYIYFDRSKQLADFSIYYIETESFAGCND